MSNRALLTYLRARAKEAAKMRDLLWKKHIKEEKETPLEAIGGADTQDLWDSYRHSGREDAFLQVIEYLRRFK